MLFLTFFFLFLVAGKFFIGEIAYVSSDSMHPTLSRGDWIWYDKYSYGAVLPRRLLDIPVVNLLCFLPGCLKNDMACDWGYRRLTGAEIPQRMDIVIFKQKSDTNDLWIKRVIGMPGDTVHVRRGIVFVNGRPLREIGFRVVSYDSYGPVVVEPGHYFVMGDHRSNSLDSRKFGTIAYEQIVGKTRWVIFNCTSDWRFFLHRLTQKVN